MAGTRRGVSLGIGMEHSIRYHEPAHHPCRGRDAPGVGIPGRNHEVEKEPGWRLSVHGCPAGAGADASPAFPGIRWASVPGSRAQPRPGSRRWRIRCPSRLRAGPRAASTPRNTAGRPRRPASIDWRTISRPPGPDMQSLSRTRGCGPPARSTCPGSPGSAHPSESSSSGRARILQESWWMAGLSSTTRSRFTRASASRFPRIRRPRQHWAEFLALAPHPPRSATRRHPEHLSYPVSIGGRDIEGERGTETGAITLAP